MFKEAFAPRYELRWRSERVAALASKHKINGRGDLSTKAGIGRTTAYKSFRPDWTGTATATVLAQIAGLFSVKPDILVEVVRVK